jgi:sugar-phosphatase
VGNCPYLDPAYVIQHAHGRRSAETLRVVAPELEANQENLKVEQMEIEDKEGIVAVPGAVGLLSRLPEERFTIVTSATPSLAVARLRHVGVPIPKRFITADDVVNGKPSPEPYLKGAALLGMAPADCLVFEDTPAGIRSAQAAGMRVIALQTTYPAEELTTADAMVRSLEEVEVWLREDRIEVVVG